MNIVTQSYNHYIAVRIIALYVEAKKTDTMPELVKTVEELLSKKQEDSQLKVL
jgi:hypothetical protein